MRVADAGVDLAPPEPSGEAGAYSEGDEYRAGPYLCCAKGQGTECCPSENQGLCFEYGGLYGACRSEGEEYEGKVICAHCCAGLTPVTASDVVSVEDAGLECGGAPPSILRCVRCGDGTCGVGENRCNCPADCRSEDDAGPDATCDTAPLWRAVTGPVASPECYPDPEGVVYIVVDGDGRVVDNSFFSGDPVALQAWLDSLGDQRCPCLSGLTVHYSCLPML